MTTPNNLHLLGWAYESTPRTAVITAANSTTYRVGTFEESTELSPPSFMQTVEEYSKYSQRESAGLSLGYRQFTPINLTYFMNNAIPLYWFLGQCTAGTPNVLSALNTGSKKAFTLRFEHSGGSNGYRVNACGCYAQSVILKGAFDRPLSADVSLLYGKIEDQDDRVALTTVPVLPNSEEGLYLLNSIKFNSTTLDYGIATTISMNQDFVMGNLSETEVVHYPGRIRPYDILVTAFVGDATFWNAMMDKTSFTLTLKYQERASTKYIECVFTGCRSVSHQLSGKSLGGGYFTASCNLRASSLTVNVSDGLTQATFYPTIT